MAETRLTKNDIIAFAHANGFEDVGFTSTVSFDTHKTFLENRQKEYGWALAQLGGNTSRNALTEFSPRATGLVLEEIKNTIEITAAVANEEHGTEKRSNLT